MELQDKPFMEFIVCMPYSNSPWSLGQCESLWVLVKWVTIALTHALTHRLTLASDPSDWSNNIGAAAKDVTCEVSGGNSESKAHLWSDLSTMKSISTSFQVIIILIARNAVSRCRDFSSSCHASSLQNDTAKKKNGKLAILILWCNVFRMKFYKENVWSLVVCKCVHAHAVKKKG